MLGEVETDGEATVEVITTLFVASVVADVFTVEPFPL